MKSFTGWKFTGIVCELTTFKKHVLKLTSFSNRSELNTVHNGQIATSYGMYGHDFSIILELKIHLLQQFWHSRAPLNSRPSALVNDTTKPSLNTLSTETGIVCPTPLSSMFK